MNKLFYPRLAAQNIQKNSKFYLPYLLTCIGTVAMFYIMGFIASNPGIKDMPGGGSLGAIMAMGVFVIGMFALIFLFYTNSFLMKRRNKELGLYNILGMEKRHIARILTLETLYCFVISMVCGLLLGVLFSKLVYMILCRMVDFAVPIGFQVSGVGILFSMALFAGIFFLILLNSLRRIHLSKPIELLHSDDVGEREPRTKWILALAGVMFIGVGYYIAITTESPLKALALFFVAVILVIIGTYCLFTAGSIAVLKLLRKNKAYYYQTKHFTSVSGMLYRMKQNAVGLANICILSTMVLVMVSTTVALYIGTDDALKARYPGDINVEMIQGEEQTLDVEGVRAEAEQALQAHHCTVKAVRQITYLSFTMERAEGQFLDSTYNAYNSDTGALLICITQEQYEQLTGKELGLQANETAVFTKEEPLDAQVTLFGQTLAVTQRLDDFPGIADFEVYMMKTYYFVVADQPMLETLVKAQQQAYGDRANQISVRLEWDLDGEKADIIDAAAAIGEITKQSMTHTYIDVNGNVQEETYYHYQIQCRQEAEADFYGLYGGFLFLGVFLGFLFLMATVLIMYYKQISEGYDDKRRYEIMQKVGMTRGEVYKSINSQIVMIFFLPLLTAAIHVLAAFKMITRLLVLFNLTNVTLFAWCTVFTVLAFAAIYSVVYLLTSRVYYHIVR